MERDILESNSIALDGGRIDAFNECRLQQWRNQCGKRQFIFHLVLEFVYNISENKKIVHLGPTLGNSKHENANHLN